MIFEPISCIEIIDSGDLLITLESGGKPDYQHVYREAREVYWDNLKNGFTSPVPRKWSYFDWFKHICEVTKEIGINLQLTEKTEFSNTSKEFKSSIKHCFNIK